MNTTRKYTYITENTEFGFVNPFKAPAEFIATYNRLVDRINSFVDERGSVPEEILNGMNNLVKALFEAHNS